MIDRGRTSGCQADELAGDGAQGHSEGPPDGDGGGLPSHRVEATSDGLPRPKAQRNFTDPDSRIVKRGGEFIQGYNCQIVVDSANQIIVAEAVTNQPPDTDHLAPMLELVKSALVPAPEAAKVA